MTTELSESQAERPRSNVFDRIAGVLFTPAETFEDIVRRPHMVAPLLLFVALGYLATILIAPHVDYDSLKAAQIAQLEKGGTKLTGSDLERMERFMVASTKVGMWLNPLFMILVYVVFAAVLWLAFRLMGGEGNFTQAFVVTLYAWVPVMVYTLITAVVVLARGSFDPMNAATLVKSNPAFLVDQKAQPVLFSLLSSFDLFALWTVFLFVLGFAAVSRLSRTMSAGIVLTMWLVMVLLKLGYTAFTA